MSKNKTDKGKLYKKLHQLQKRVTRWLSNGSEDKVKEAEYKEKKIIEKIKGNGK